jgi:hypothetical protein
MWRQTSIHNALSYLDALFDRDLYERTHDATLLATGDRERAHAAGWAAIIAAAVRMERSGQPTPGSPGGSGPTLPAPDASALVRIAEALTTSGSLPDTPVHPGPTARGAV